MDLRVIKKVLLIVGLLVVAYWLLKLTVKLFVPLVLISIGAYVWYKYFRGRKIND